MKACPKLFVIAVLMQQLNLFAASYESDLDFLRHYTDAIVLHDPSGQAQVIVTPAWQGRVMTSTAGGESGDSFGWVNRELIASGKIQPHINVFGGEDRFWLGPEGGQFGLFFAKGASFDLEHWQTPAALDTEPFTTIKQGDDRVLCRREIQFTNYSGTPFDLEVKREVVLLKSSAALAAIGVKPRADVKAVAYESINTVKNIGPSAWNNDTGMLSIWILGMFNASAQSTIVIPFKPGTVEQLGPIVNDNYFGKVPAERLVVGGQVLFFRADANERCKIGLSPFRVKSILGSYDAAHHVLTFIKYNLPSGTTNYVNSMWQWQKNPFAGDVVNSYSDNGKLGQFYELETSSPALALNPGESATHRRTTIHLQGDETVLDTIAYAALKIHLNDITNAFKE